ncbi:hypothetical protein [Streptacidiphilus sp. EB129]|uniref:hypothetical protein n=1 Tax=Streptacidiphilus sp. EB129 TaxID=3156262 RepID=UPI00351519B1
MSTADAVARETAWLTAYDPTDGLPGLLEGSGGPFGVVQAYWRRTPPMRRNQLYVMRRGLKIERFGFNRKIIHYQFALRILWPISSNRGDFESVQQSLDNAVDLVLQRVSGPLALPMDKTHGARFMSVAEDPCQIDVSFGDPERQSDDQLEATITYLADDQDYLS